MLGPLPEALHHDARELRYTQYRQRSLRSNLQQQQIHENLFRDAGCMSAQDLGPECSLQCVGTGCKNSALSQLSNY